MPSRSALASVIADGVGTNKEVNILVNRVGVIIHLAPAVAASKNIAEQAFLCIFRFRCPAFGVFCKLLHTLKYLSLNNRLLQSLEYAPSGKSTA